MESDLISFLLKQVARKQRHSDLVFLFLQRSEIRANFDRLIRLQQCAVRVEGDLIFVLLRDAPLVLNRNTRVILDLKLLLGLHAYVSRREE